MKIRNVDFGPRMISGQISGAGERPVRIRLTVDGCLVAGNWGIPSGDDTTQTFRFNLSEIWQYVGASARFQVSADDHVLDLPLPGFARRPEFSLTDLQEKLTAGHVFNEKGGLQLSKTLDTAWQKKMFLLYDELRALLRCRGIDLVVMYGTLLGAFRGGDFIGHDHDFDAGYISAHADPAEVRRELVDVAETLIRRGFRVVCKGTCIWVTDPHSKVTIDIFQTYFDASGKLQFPFGVCGVKAFTKAEFDGYREIDLAGHKVLAPSDTGALIEYIYGPHWKTPNPGHNWTLDRTEADRLARPSPADRTRIYLADINTHGRAYYPSSFSEFVSGSRYLRRNVVDLGCGNGRDTLHFSRTHPCVIGVDKSALAIDAARAFTQSHPLGRAISFVRADATDPAVMKDVITKARAGSTRGGVTIYARFLLHVLSAGARDNLLKACADQMDRGDSIALEFRTDKDSGLKRAHDFRHRSYVPAADVADRLQQLALQVVTQHEGTGFSVYLDENPCLCRIIAVKR